MAEPEKYQNRIELESEWKLTESKQRAKYYRLTALGKKQLTVDHERWLRIVRAISAIMEPEAQR
jgi:DNA-binding PadR family transcriptional regulator